MPKYRDEPASTALGRTDSHTGCTGSLGRAAAAAAEVGRNWAGPFQWAQTTVRFQRDELIDKKILKVVLMLSEFLNRYEGKK